MIQLESEYVYSFRVDMCQCDCVTKLQLLSVLELYFPLRPIRMSIFKQILADCHFKLLRIVRMVNANSYNN